MKKILPSVVLIMAVFLVSISGCTAAVSSLTAAPIPSPTILPPTVTPSPLATATSTTTVTPTFTLTATPTDTETPTDTVTPSQTPTSTPQFNLPGVYSVGRCVQFGFTYNDPAPGGTGVVSMCIVNVQVFKNHSMQFNMLWHLVSASGQTPNRYIYGNIDAVYLTDEFGNRYDPLANSGKKPDRDENNDGADSTSGWYLFPPPVKDARLFTFHDDDGKSVAIVDMEFITR
jgi:hypothetical protein